MTFDPSKISKTTAIGVLGFVIVEVIAWNTLPPKAGLSVTILALLRAAIHFLQTDADMLKASTPGNPTDENQAAHPVLNDPSVAEGKKLVHPGFFRRLILGAKSNAVQPAVTAKADEVRMGFLKALEGDAKKVLAWIGSPKTQAVLAVGETAVEDAFPQATNIIGLINTGATEAFKVEALAEAAGATGTTSSQKSGAVLNVLTSEILSFFKSQGKPVPAAAQIQTVNDNIVEIINILSGVTATKPAVKS